MEAQEQNRLLDITKFVDSCGYKLECYINPKHITKIYKSMFDDCYLINVGGNIISLYNVKTKQELNKFLDYIYNR